MLTPNVVPDFTALRLAVVGDIIADQYLYARPSRLSREAPVMIMQHTGEEIGAGGAANVARNLWSFGARTMVLGAVGKESVGREVLRILENEQIDVQGVEAVNGWVTPTKTRILGADPGRTMHQVLRIDREPKDPIDATVRMSIAQRLRSLAGRIDCLLVSDYGYGLVDQEVAAVALELHAAGVKVVLDPRNRLELFRGISAMTPNLGELATTTGRQLEELRTLQEVTRAAREFRERFAPEALLVTMGNRGMALFTDEFPEGVTIRAAGSEAVIDVSGAGDTAASAFTLGLAAGLAGPRAMRLANAAAGVVVMEYGAAVCPLSKLRSSLPHSPQPATTAAIA